MTGPAIDFVARARELAPRVRDLADQIEADRRLPADLVDAFSKAGFFAMLLPEDLGGLQSDPVTAARVVEEVAAADGSAGWCVMLACQSQTFAGLMPGDDARAIWGQGAIVAGTARPTGRAVKTNDPAPGYIVSGRWPFASGSSHATWFQAECMLYDGDEPIRDADGNHRSRVVFVPRDAVRIIETWDTLGLRGTASNDFVVENTWVPETRGFQMLVDPPHHPWPLYAAHPLLFINHGTQALGVARGSLDAMKELANTKIGWGGVPIKAVTRVQSVVGEATALVEAARTYLYTTATELWEAALASAATERQRSRVRLATTHAARSSVQAVDLLHAAAGTSGIFRDNPLERRFRDIHTAAAHVMIGQMTMEAAGRVELGMPAEFPFF